MTPYAEAPVEPLPLPPRPGLAKADWFAFVTAPQREQIAGAALQARDLTVFVPIERRLRFAANSKFAKRKEAVEKPLFTGYLFVRADRPLDWLGLLSLNDRNGFRLFFGVVGFDGQPAAIKHEAMQRVIEIVGQTADRQVAAPRSVVAGGKVRIVDGPFRWGAASPLKVESLSEEAATLFVELFGRATRVTIPLEHLEAVP